MQQVIDYLDIAAKAYPIKALAPDIGKAESTLRSELNQQEGYKLGLVTTFQILKTTGDFSALDRIEHLLGRVAFEIPKAEAENVNAIMHLMGDLSREFGEHITCMAQVMEDGKITPREAREALKELNDVLTAGAQLKATLEKLS